MNLFGRAWDAISGVPPIPDLVVKLSGPENYAPRVRAYKIDTLRKAWGGHVKVEWYPLATSEGIPWKLPDEIAKSREITYGRIAGVGPSHRNTYCVEVVPVGGDVKRPLVIPVNCVARIEPYIPSEGKPKPKKPDYTNPGWWAKD